MFLANLNVFLAASFILNRFRLADREKRYQNGQYLVFGANALMFAPFVLPMLFAAVLGKPEYMYLSYYLMLPMIAGLIAAPFGIYMVLSSRA